MGLWRSRELLSGRLALSWSVCALCLRVPLDQREEFFFSAIPARASPEAVLCRSVDAYVHPSRASWRSRTDPLLRDAAPRRYELVPQLSLARAKLHAAKKCLPTPPPRHLTNWNLLLDLPVVVLVHRVIFFSLGDDLHLRLARLLDLFFQFLFQLRPLQII